MPAPPVDRSHAGLTPVVLGRATRGTAWSVGRGAIVVVVTSGARTAVTQWMAAARSWRTRRASSPPFERRVLDASSLSRNGGPRVPAVSASILAYQGMAASEIVAVVEGLATEVTVAASVVGIQPGSVVAVEPVYEVRIDTALGAAAPSEVVVVPGGIGWRPLAEDERVLGWIRRAAQDARALVAVSTGSLLVAAAGLLEGEHAAGHWLASSDLAALGAVPDASRFVEGDVILTASGANAAHAVGRRLGERICYGPQ